MVMCDTTKLPYYPKLFWKSSNNKFSKRDWSTSK